MDIQYIIGSEMTITAMKKEPALPVFSEDAVEFLDRLSKIILKNPQAKQYPDLITFAFWCRRASVMEMKKKTAWLESARERGVMGRGIVFHIAPSNVAMNFAYSFAAAFLAGNANIVRLPTKEFPQVALFCKAMAQAVTEEMDYKFCFVRYGHEQEITDFYSKLCDVRVIWGGDLAIRQIRQSPLKSRGKEIVFADRYSICVIEAKEYLDFSKDRKIKAARDFYNDTYLMDQNACSSPILVIWNGSKEDTAQAQECFWQNLYYIVKEKYELQPVQAVKKLQAACRLAAGYGNILLSETPLKNGEKADNRLTRVTLYNLLEYIADYKENSGFFMEYQTEELENIIVILGERCQTVSYLGDSLLNRIRNLVKKECPAGVDRIVPVGKTMDFSLIWDGYDLIREMSREIG